MDPISLFWVFCLLILLWRFWRGWHAGVMREAMMLVALFVATMTALFWGPEIGSLLIDREILSRSVSEPLVRWICGGLGSIIVYFVLSAIGPILFKRTGQKSIGITRLFYAVGGATLGVLRAFVLIWVLLCFVRVTGAIAQGHEAAIHGSKNSAKTFITTVPNKRYSEVAVEPWQERFFSTLSELKIGIEQGTLGAIIEAITQPVVSGQSCSDLSKMGQIVSNPVSIQRFFNSSVMKDYLSGTKLATILQSDPALSRNLSEGHYQSLLLNTKFREAFKDPQLSEKLYKMDWRHAMNEALKE